MLMVKKIEKACYGRSVEKDAILIKRVFIPLHVKKIEIGYDIY